MYRHHRVGPALELQDQLARPIETAGEEYHVVLIIEYELDAGTKVSGGVQ